MYVWRVLCIAINVLNFTSRSTKPDRPKRAPRSLGDLLIMEEMLAADVLTVADCIVRCLTVSKSLLPHDV